jgi:hypothetical protein
MLSESQKVLLSLIAEKDGKLNWYKIGRAYVNKFNTPAELSESFKYLGEEELIESREMEGEPLPRLYLTLKGKQTLAM